MTGTPQFIKDELQVHRIVGKYDVAADATGKVFGTLPKNAIPVGGYAFVKQACDGAPTVLFGIEGDTDALMASADIAPTAAGFKAHVAATLTAGAANWPLAAKKDVLATFTAGGATVGLIYYVLFYIFPNELFDAADFE